MVTSNFTKLIPTDKFGLLSSTAPFFLSRCPAHHAYRARLTSVTLNAFVRLRRALTPFAWFTSLPTHLQVRMNPQNRLRLSWSHSPPSHRQRSRVLLAATFWILREGSYRMGHNAHASLRHNSSQLPAGYSLRTKEQIYLCARGMLFTNWPHQSININMIM